MDCSNKSYFLLRKHFKLGFLPATAEHCSFLYSICSLTLSPQRRKQTNNIQSLLLTRNLSLGLISQEKKKSLTKERRRAMPIHSNCDLALRHAEIKNTHSRCNFVSQQKYSTYYRNVPMDNFSRNKFQPEFI